jgi:hypothetical protein
MGGESAVRSVADAVIAHRLHRLLVCVHDKQPQTRCRESALQNVHRYPATGLSTSDRGDADADTLGQLPLTQISPAAGPAQGAGDIEVFAHDSTLVAGSRRRKASCLICGQPFRLWTTT